MMHLRLSSFCPKSVHLVDEAEAYTAETELGIWSINDEQTSQHTKAPTLERQSQQPRISSDEMEPQIRPLELTRGHEKRKTQFVDRPYHLLILTLQLAILHQNILANDWGPIWLVIATNKSHRGKSVPTYVRTE